MALKAALLSSLVRRQKFVNFAYLAIKQQRNEDYRDESKSRFSFTNRYTVPGALFGTAIIASKLKDDPEGSKKKCPWHKTQKAFEAGERQQHLPTYTADEVGKHDSKESFWVIYKNGVYDVTSFLTSHPGGDQILNAGGHSIEPFWNVYGMHKTEEVYRLLETYRIGNIAEADMCDHSDDEMWAKEPVRSRELIVKTAKPFNAEVPPRAQIQHFDTPNELFYVRQHMPVPEIDADRHKVSVVIKDGGSTTVTEFSLKELDQFEKHNVRAALMCAGNRRSEMNKVKPVKGISWAGGAISNARWRGVLLRDVLRRCGVDDNTSLEGKHVIFQGVDIDATGENFSTSIPLHMALSPTARVLLVTEMNDAPLPPDHGFPIRALVPGAPAVRSVKWLEKIIISTDESPSHWHQKDYRGFNPSKTWETADFAAAPPVYSLPVTSAFCDPQDGDVVHVKDGHVTVRGYAYSGGGAKILRVDVTTDHGHSWHEATPKAEDAAPFAQHYSWMLWEATVPVLPQQKEVELWVKATDSNFNTQPERFDDIWNIRGILSNAYHRITVQLKHNT